MSCVPVTPQMSDLLEACRTWPLPTEILEELEAMPEWEQARTWGWIMQTGRLTGTGSRHAEGEPPRGIIR
jgi:hypothetical protein